MGNVFKSVAKFLDNALSGGEVDVIVMEEKPLDAAAAVGGLVTGELVTGEAGAAEAESVTGVLVTSSEGEGAGDNAGAREADAAGDAGDSAEGEAADTGADASDGAGEASADVSGAEPQSIAAVQQMLGEGQVAVNAAELESLRVDAGKWKENEAELKNLREWKANGSQANVMQGAADAADAVGAPAKKVSAATQKAIDLKNKLAGN